MVTIEEIQAAYYMVAATGVLVAAAYYILNLRVSQRNQQLSLKTQEQTLETRQTQLTMQLYQMMYSKEYIDNYYEFMNDWSWTDYDDFMK